MLIRENSPDLAICLPLTHLGKNGFNVSIEKWITKTILPGTQGIFAV